METWVHQFLATLLRVPADIFAAKRMGELLAFGVSNKQLQKVVPV